MSNAFIEQKPLLPPHCEAKPPVPVDPKYKPPGSEPFYVNDDHTWAKVAEYAKMDVLKLIEYNFNTNVFAHINWYLHNYVGCTRISKDKANFGFSTKDIKSPWTPRGGTVYIPAAVPPPPKPVPIPVPVPPPDISLGCQDLLFSARFSADSFLDEFVASAAEVAKEMDLLTKIGGYGVEALKVIDRIWIITGILTMEIDGYDDASTYCWRFGTIMGAFWTVPLTGNSDYETDWKRMRMNLDVLDPRGSWDYNLAEFTLTRGALAIEVRNALARNPSPDYRPFPDQVLASGRNLTISLPLLQNGPVGLVSTLPGMACQLKPLGYMTAEVAYRNMQSKLERLKKQVGL